MAARNREIESKWYSSLGMDEVRAKLEESLGAKRANVIHAKGIDTYWALSDSKFVRIREREVGCQLTVKNKDRDNNINRVEIDVNVASTFEQTEKLLSAIHGDATGSVNKAYWVYWLKGEDEHTNVSLYTVKGHPGTFIEFEASTKAKLLEIEEKYLTDLGEISSQPKSLYELFILPKKERFVL